MRYWMKGLLLIWLVLRAGFSVSADMVGHWQNQAGQVIEVRADGQVQQVAENGVAELFNKMTNLLTMDSRQSTNWEHAPAGQGFASLRQEGLTDQSDWTRERIWDKSAPLSDFKTAVYYRVQTEKKQEKQENSTSQQTSALSTPATSIEIQETSETEEGQEIIDKSSQEEKVITLPAEESVQLVEAVETVEPAVVEIISPTSSSVGQRSKRQSTRTGSSETAKQTKKSDPELPKANDESEFLVMLYGLILLVFPIFKSSNYLIKKFKPVIIELKKTL